MRCRSLGEHSDAMPPGDPLGFSEYTSVGFPVVGSKILFGNKFLRCALRTEQASLTMRATQTPPYSPLKFYFTHSQQDAMCVCTRDGFIFLHSYSCRTCHNLRKSQIFSRIININRCRRRVRQHAHNTIEACFLRITLYCHMHKCKFCLIK